ncbi:chaplin family protein [Sphaerisporangium sp. NPDC049003]|uniref:chaplin family protein n=1 Tax=Sphaerisporangium sp. NPDC049003 TaxID=3364517 RepID=UPI003717873D
MALSSGTALADTSGSGSVGGGNQINLPINIPIDISGNAVAVAGESSASSRGGSSVQGGSGAGGIQGSTSGHGSVLGGNQVNAPISAPVNACGNAVSLVGRSDAGCQGGATVRNGGGGGGAGGNLTDGRHSVLGGNQIVAPINAPINACGNAVAVIGEATAGCRGGASVQNGGGGRGAGGNRTSGHSSVLGGNQIVAPITAPINICGNSVAVLGEAFSGCRGGAHVKGGGGGNGYNGNGPRRGPGAGGNLTDGRHSILGGNQIIAPITAPINVCGNAVGNGSAGCEGGISVPPAGRGGGAGGNRTSGHSSVLGGNQIVAPITAPINVCGNSVAVFGEAFSGCRGGASVKGGGGRGAGGNLTDGRHSILGGNQIVAPITAPINVCGNAVAVLGDAAAGCLGGAHAGGGNGGNGGQGGYGHWARSSGQVSGARPAGYGLLSETPLLSALQGERAAGDLTRQSGGTGDLNRRSGEASELTRGSGEALPVGGLGKALGLPELPATPGRADGVQKPQAPAADSPLGPVGKVLSGTPASGVVNGSMTRDLPVNTGLMSAEQPLGVTGMNAGSLAALLVGALFAVSATLFAGTRRLRLRRK